MGWAATTLRAMARFDSMQWFYVEVSAVDAASHKRLRNGEWVRASDEADARMVALKRYQPSACAVVVSVARHTDNGTGDGDGNDAA